MTRYDLLDNAKCHERIRQLRRPEGVTCPHFFGITQRGGSVVGGSVHSHRLLGDDDQHPGHGGGKATVGLAPVMFSSLMDITGLTLSSWWRKKPVKDKSDS